MEYDEQLDRALEASPDVESSGRRFSLPEPDVRHEGTTTVYENFQSTIETLDRDATHVMTTLQDELGTSASIDDRGRLRLTGEFRTDRVRDVTETYADDYVLCPECGLPDTRLETENGVAIRRCEACGARSPTGD